jgi:hypothetical protein
MRHDCGCSVTVVLAGHLGIQPFPRQRNLSSTDEFTCSLHPERAFTKEIPILTKQLSLAGDEEFQECSYLRRIRWNSRSHVSEQIVVIRFRITVVINDSVPDSPGSFEQFIELLDPFPAGMLPLVNEGLHIFLENC